MKVSARLAERTYLAERVRNRLHRLWSDLPQARLSSELQFRADRAAHRLHGPIVAADAGLLESLRTTGIAVTTVDAFGLADVVAAAQPLIAELLAVPTPADLPATHLAADRLADSPEIFRWGASDRVLDLLEHYFEVPVAYHGVYLRRDMAVEQPGASNLWHLDMEDRKVIKIVVYLTDVADGDGSFQYLPLEQSLELRRSLGMTYRLGTDVDMMKLVPDDQWRTAKGSAGTVLISDTAVLFHKGRRPQQRDRVTLFYDYTSSRPTHPFYCKSALPRRHLEQLSEDLGQRAQKAVFWRPRLTEFDPDKHE
ncbi:MAG: hypothetical protein ACR2LI_12320 [Propionibacteriaceae bacterium]